MKCTLLFGVVVKPLKELEININLNQNAGYN